MPDMRSECPRQSKKRLTVARNIRFCFRFRDIPPILANHDAQLDLVVHHDALGDLDRSFARLDVG
jgi:hypothetical protein